MTKIIMNRLIRYLPLLLITLLTLASHLMAQSTNRVALVVSFGEGNVVAQCVEFSEPEITGLEVLQRAGMDVTAQVQGLGAAVCSIDDTGCPSDDCFCQCSGGGACHFWNYWHLVNGNWQFSQVGSSIYPVHDGDVEGWAWGIGASGGNGDQPPVYSFDQICAVAVTDTPVPTSTAVPPTHTPVPPTSTDGPDAEIAFWAEATTVLAGSCTLLRWEVEHVTAVFLDNFGVEGQGTLEVCPLQTETYTLHIVHPDGEEERQITVSVIVPTGTAVPPAQAITQPATNLATATLTSPTATVSPTETTVPTVITTTAVEVMATAVATSQATATFAVIAIDIPLLSTATALPTATAELPPATQTPIIAPSPALPTIPLEQWLAYAIFGMIVTGLGVILWLGRR